MEKEGEEGTWKVYWVEKEGEEGAWKVYGGGERGY